LSTTYLIPKGKVGMEAVGDSVKISATRAGRGTAITSFAGRPLQTLKPEQAVEQYAQPRQQLARLTRNGDLHRTANGYYVVVPRARKGTFWLPSLEAVAAGIGAADFGIENAILMGVSAARMHGAIPRALAEAVVAVPDQRARIRLRDRDGTVTFVKRRTARLDAELMTTELGPALVTTVEQTVLDLAHRPSLGHAADEISGAVNLLLPRCDRERLAELAHAQRLRAALARAEGMN